VSEKQPVKPRGGQEEASAYHEAGHAVVAVLLGIRIGKEGASIIPECDTEGWVHLRKGFSGNPKYDNNIRVRDGLETRVMISLAGEAAQRHFRPSSVRSDQGMSDRHHAVNELSYLASSPEELEPYLKWLDIRVNRMIACHWKQTATVANALLEKKRLSAKEVGALIYPPAAYKPSLSFDKGDLSARPTGKS
jgi:hypothetical protein